MRRRLGITSFFCAAMALSSTAAAHVRFEYPTPRYPNPTGAFDNGANIKESPCGAEDDSRTANPERITELESGATITVRYRETIGHDGFYRISFDDDGQDAFEPPPLSRADIKTTPTEVVLKDDIPDGAGDIYETEVTLPDIECDNCTLQLIQVMTDAQTWPRSEIYYTCADITLKRANGAGGMGGTGAGGANGGAGTGGMSAGGANGGAGAGGMGTGGSPGGSPGSSGSGGTGNTSGAGGAPSGGSTTGGTTSATGGTGVATAGTSAAGRSSGGAPGTAGSTGGSLATAGSPSTPPGDTVEEEGGCSIGSVRSHGTSAAVVTFLGALLLAFGARRQRR